MSKKSELVGPWRTIHGAVWLIGLAILFWKGWFWPGILVLIAISGLVEAIIQLTVPEATAPAAGSEGQASATPTEPAYQVSRLPSECPKCNAPVRGNEVQWTGTHSANCAYCGANLPLQDRP